MCDYCDCRSHPELADLGREHERLHELLDGVRRATSAGADRVRAAVAELAAVLEPHADREDGGLLAQLRTQVDAAYLDLFVADHERIRALLGAATAGDAEAAAELVVVLSEHIAREESDLFPTAHQLLTPRQWDAVDDHAASRAGAPRGTARAAR